MSEKYIDETAEVSNESVIRDSVKIWQNCQVREGAEVGKKCTLSKDVYVGVDVKIGEKCKLQNGVSIFEGVTLEDNVFCGPHMTFTNDLNIRINPESYEPIETYVEEGVAIGAHSTILPGITLGSYSMVGAQSLVTKTVPGFALVYGNPARIQGVVCYCGEKIADIDVGRDRNVFKCSQCGEKVKIDRKAFAKRRR